MIVQNPGFFFFNLIGISWFLEGHDVFAAKSYEFDDRTTPDPEYDGLTPIDDDSELSTQQNDSSTGEHNLSNSTPATPYGGPNVKNDNSFPTVYNPTPPPTTYYGRPNVQNFGPYQGPFMQGGPYGGPYMPQFPVGTSFPPMPYGPQNFGPHVPYSPGPMPFGHYLPRGGVFSKKRVKGAYPNTVSAFHKFSFFNPQFLNNVKLNFGK